MKAWMLGLISLLPMSNVAHANRVALLGSVQLEDQRDYERIYLPPCDQSPNNRIDYIQFSVSNYPVHISAVNLTFGNGETHNLNVNGVFYPREATRWFNLDRGTRERCVRMIEVWGRARIPGDYSRQKAGIHFYGY
ncbi:DUF2541 family protein [bacterium]|nr:DUF2541 family protein [bacterium]